MSTVIRADARSRRGRQSKRRGHDRERLVGGLLEERGWVVIRAAGSMGDVDLVAVGNGLVWHPSDPKPGVRLLVERAVLLIEVKSTLGPYSGFPPAQRVELAAAAAKCGAEAWLAWWPSRGDLRWIPSREWPGARASG